MNHQAWLNGVLCDHSLMYDRGLAYGDGFFTTILCYNRQPLNWPGHFQRIQHSLQRLKLGDIKTSELINELQAALSQSAWDGFSILKLIVTRGSGGRGYAPPKPPKLQRLIYVMPAPFQAENTASLAEINAIVCQTSASINPSLAGLKHLNRLENVLARDEVLEQKCDEGLMLNGLGHLVGGAQSNVVLIQQGSDGRRQALTPELDLSGVQGTCLSALKNLSLGLSWREQKITVSDLHGAESLFVCNAVRGVQAVKQLIISDQVKIDYAVEPVQTIHQAWWLWNLSQPGFNTH